MPAHIPKQASFGSKLERLCDGVLIAFFFGQIFTRGSIGGCIDITGLGGCDFGLDEVGRRQVNAF